MCQKKISKFTLSYCPDLNSGLLSFQHVLVLACKPSTHVHSASLSQSLQVKEKMFRKSDLLDEIPRMPDFMVALRPHTVWEKTPVKLFCTVQGTPRPIVKWSECPSSHYTSSQETWRCVILLGQEIGAWIYNSVSQTAAGIKEACQWIHWAHQGNTRLRTSTESTASSSAGME